MMTANAYFKLPKVLRRLYEGPLGDYVDLYAAQLLREGIAIRVGGAVSELSLTANYAEPAPLVKDLKWCGVGLFTQTTKLVRHSSGFDING